MDYDACDAFGTFVEALELLRIIRSEINAPRVTNGSSCSARNNRWRSCGEIVVLIFFY
jgi:hypothetical protein